MIGTGADHVVPRPHTADLRTGSTFVHDWLAIAIGLLVIGHIYMAVQDPEARRGLRTGWVSRLWARREHSLWEKESRRAPED